MIRGAITRIKGVFKKVNGDEIVDLISSTFNFKKSSRTGIGVIRVREEELMRPDLVANRVYGDQNKFDVILKYNGISNPFSLNFGEFLTIPSFSDAEAMVVAPTPIVEKGIEKKTSTEDKLLEPKTVKDKKRLEALKDKTREIVPPNVNTTGNKNVKVRDGRVIFGEDVTQYNKDNCPVPISRARLIQQLTKANLF